MKITMLLLFLLVTSNVFSKGSPKPTVPQTPTQTPSADVKGVHFSPVINYTSEEKQVLVVSEKLSNELLQSKCFETFMVNREFNGQKGLIDTQGMTAEQVVQKLKTTNLTIPVQMYYKRFSNVVGYRQPPSLTVYTNRKFHAGATACSRGSNLLHEWSHSVGFEHSYNATPSRPRSVPYSINAAFEACCVCVKSSILNCSIRP